MSFTSQVKDEIIKLNGNKAENLASLSAFVRNNAKIANDQIILSTELVGITKWLYLYFKDIYNIDIKVEVSKNITLNKSKIYYIYIYDKIDMILKDLSVIDDNNNFLDVPKEYIVGDIEEIKAYIRGVFLSKGSINDPKTARYHLEFLFDSKHESVFVQRLLNKFELNSKIILRDRKYMVYLKDSEKISDFLKILGASKAVMYYEDIRVYKEQKNVTNRLNNCEQANIDKAIQTATNQINQIELIDKKLGLDFLDEKIKEVIAYRLKYPEASLTELSEIISIETNKNITKSGLNHRFRKIKDIYEKLNK